METPTLAQVIRRFIREDRWSLYTALPATVVSFDGTGRPVATVQPFPDDYAQGQAVPHPQLANVPVSYPGPIRWPLNPGDVCLVIFCSRSLDRYRGGQGEGDPQDNERTHDLSDCWVLPLEGGNAGAAIGTGPAAARVGDSTGDGSLAIAAASVSGGVAITLTYTPPSGIQQIATVTVEGAVTGVGAGVLNLTGTITSGSPTVEID